MQRILINDCFIPIISKKDLTSFISFCIGGLVCLLIPFLLSTNEFIIRYGNIASFLRLSYFLTSFSFLFNHLRLAARIKASKIVLYSGIAVTILGILLKLLDINAAGIVIVAGFSIVAFTYSTILSTIRREKWAGYAQKKWQVILMRFGDISGIGYLFQVF